MELVGYRLGHRLDDLGEIYEGHHPSLGGQFVIKLFGRLARENSAALAAFSREAGRVSILRHPHIAQVLDSGVLRDRTPFTAMERLHGRTLEEHLALRRPLPVAHLLPLVRGIVSGLSAAHAAGVVHREIRPDNVFLVDVGDDQPGLVKLLDFGVSRLTWAEGTNSRGVGVARYLAPEQERGDLSQVDPRADQFAVAALICRVLRATEPHPGNLVAAKSDRASRPRPRPSIPMMSRVSAVKGVLIKALSEHPRDRYPLVADFLWALEEALSGSATFKMANVPVTAGLRDRSSRPDPLDRDGREARRQFSRAGELRQKHEEKAAPIVGGPVITGAEIAFASFDRVPRQRSPLTVVAIATFMVVSGLATWEVGRRSPPKAEMSGRGPPTAGMDVERAHGAASEAALEPALEAALEPTALPSPPEARAFIAVDPGEVASASSVAPLLLLPPTLAAGARRKSASALRGYVWSPTEQRLVRSRSLWVPRETTPQTLDVSAAGN